MVQRKSRNKIPVNSKEKEDKDTIQKLKRRVSRLEREKKQLKSDIKSLESALNKGFKKIRVHTDDYTVDEAIESVTKNKEITDLDRKEKLISEMRKRFGNND